MKRLKRWKQSALPFFCIFVLIPGILGAGGKVDASKESSARDFGFRAMEIFKFNFQTSYLTVRDMNNDGLDDILFLNNKDSRLEILLRKKDGKTFSPGRFPRIEEKFVNRGFVLDQWTRSFIVADVNADSRPDLLCIGDQVGLVVRLQSPSGSFSQPVSRRIKNANDIVNFSVTDINGDTYHDLMICRRSNAELFWNNGKGEFKSNTQITFSASGCRGGITADINHDGKTDLLFYFGGDVHALRVRLGLGHGRFGWEHSLPLPAVRSLRRVDLPGKDRNTPSSLLAVILKNGIISRLYDFDIRKQDRLLTRMGTAPQRLPLMGIGDKDNAAWVSADFNRDNHTDFCIAAPQLSQVHLYMGSADGLNPIPRTIDSLTSIQTLDVTENGDLVVFSAIEKAIGIHPRAQLEKFPSFFKAPGKPVAAAVAQPFSLFAIYKEKSGEIKLHEFDSRKPDTPPLWSVSFKTLHIDNPPTAINVFPIEKDNRWLVMLFMPYEPPAVFTIDRGTGKTSPVTPDKFRAMALNLAPEAVTSIGGRDAPTLLITEGKVARIYQWQDGRFLVKRQLNPGRKTARLTSACLFNQGRSKQTGYLVYDQLGQDLIWFASSPHSTPRAVDFKGGLKGIVGLSPFRLDKSKGLLMIGKNEMQWVRDNQQELVLNILGEYSSPVEQPSLWTIAPLELGSPGSPMLALLDSNNRSIEIVSMHAFPGADNKLRSGGDSIKNHRGLKGELVFEVFQDPGFNEAAESYEPHSVNSGDFNNDNIRDLAVLVHDKLIIYLGE